MEENTLTLTSPFSENFTCIFLCNDDVDKTSVCKFIPILVNLDSPFSIGKELLWYDKENDYYWKYIVTNILLYSQSEIICKLSISFTYDFPLTYFSYLNSFEKEYYWNIVSNCILNPTIENALCYIYSDNIEYEKCKIKRIFGIVPNNDSFLYKIEPLSITEQILYKDITYIPFIKIIEDNNFNLINKWIKKYNIKLIEKSDSNDIQCSNSELSEMSDETSVETSTDESNEISVTSNNEIISSYHNPDSNGLAHEKEFLQSTESSIEKVVDDTVVDLKLVDETNVKQTIVERTIVDPTLVDPTLVNATVVDPTLVNTTVVDQTIVDQTIVDQTIVDTKVADIKIKNYNNYRTVVSDIVNQIVEKIEYDDTFTNKVNISSNQQFENMMDCVSANKSFKNQIVYENIKNLSTTSIKTNDKNKKKKNKSKNKLNNIQNDEKSLKSEILLYIISNFDTKFDSILKFKKLDRNVLYEKYISYAQELLNSSVKLEDKDYYLNEVKTHITNKYVMIDLSDFTPIDNSTLFDKFGILPNMPDKDLLKFIHKFNSILGEFTKYLDNNKRKELLIRFATIPIYDFIKYAPSYINMYLNVEEIEAKHNIELPVFFTIECLLVNFKNKFINNLDKSVMVERYLLFEPSCMKLIIQLFLPFVIEGTTTGITSHTILSKYIQIMEIHLALIEPHFNHNNADIKFLDKYNFDVITRMMVRGSITIRKLLDDVHENATPELTRLLSYYYFNFFYRENSNLIDEKFLGYGRENEENIDMSIKLFFSHIIVNKS
jgi:hypothetical protein